MVALLIAFRDAIIILALSWVGISLEPPARETAPRSEPTVSAACGDASCVLAKPSFNSFGSTEK
jgi:hypothetical protein